MQFKPRGYLNSHSKALCLIALYLDFSYYCIVIKKERKKRKQKFKEDETWKKKHRGKLKEENRHKFEEKEIQK